MLESVEALENSGDANARKMMGLLENTVPVNGPPIRNPNKCKSLGSDVHEFKCGSRRGTKFRVLFFYDRDKLIICSEAFTKAERTPRQPIGRTVELMSSYADASRSGEIKIMDYMEWKENHGK